MCFEVALQQLTVSCNNNYYLLLGLLKCATAVETEEIFFFVAKRVKISSNRVPPVKTGDASFQEV